MGSCTLPDNDISVANGCLPAIYPWAVVAGMLLPPHGLLLMTMKGMAPREVTMLHVFQAVVPYVAMSLIVLALVFFVPKVAPWLPALLG